ncbi:MAG: LuxR family transcriptional regulator [Variovorax sp.]
MGGWRSIRGLSRHARFCVARRSAWSNPRGSVMAKWIEELQVEIHRARGAQEAFDHIGKAARHLGFERWAYGMRLPLPFTRPRFVTMNNYDDRWAQRYQSKGYLGIDPTVLHGTRSMVPLVWSDLLFRDAPQMWAEARSFGLCVGWAQSCFDGHGRVGMLTLARSHEKLTRRELLAHEPLLRWLANLAHMTLSSRLPRARHDAAVALTDRQVEVLKWSADGKTCEEAAAILGISAHTVHFHVKNAVSRLDAANKLAAVARATKLGLLS